MQALESGETKKRRIEVANAELQQQRLLTGAQGRPSMLRRLVKSVTSTSGASLESTIKALTGEVSFRGFRCHSHHQTARLLTSSNWKVPAVADTIRRVFFAVTDTIKWAGSCCYIIKQEGFCCESNHHKLEGFWCYSQNLLLLMSPKETGSPSLLILPPKACAQSAAHLHVSECQLVCTVSVTALLCGRAAL